MPESITITLPRAMPFAQRLLEVKKQISEWTKSLDKPINSYIDLFQLEKYECLEQNFRYHYTIVRNGMNARRRI